MGSRRGHFPDPRLPTVRQSYVGTAVSVHSDVFAIRHRGGRKVRRVDRHNQGDLATASLPSAAPRWPRPALTIAPMATGTPIRPDSPPIHPAIGPLHQPPISTSPVRASDPISRLRRFRPNATTRPNRGNGFAFHVTKRTNSNLRFPKPTINH